MNWNPPNIICQLGFNHFIKIRYFCGTSILTYCKKYVRIVKMEKPLKVLEDLNIVHP